MNHHKLVPQFNQQPMRTYDITEEQTNSQFHSRDKFREIGHFLWQMHISVKSWNLWCLVNCNVFYCISVAFLPFPLPCCPFRSRLNTNPTSVLSLAHWRQPALQPLTVSMAWQWTSVAAAVSAKISMDCSQRQLTVTACMSTWPVKFLWIFLSPWIFNEIRHRFKNATQNSPFPLVN